jgi:hypothetical protein
VSTSDDETPAEFIDRFIAVLDMATVTIEHLHDEIARLSELVPDTAAANAARKRASREKAEFAKRLRAEGMTVPEIAKVVDRSLRHTNRYFED